MVSKINQRVQRVNSTDDGKIKRTFGTTMRTKHRKGKFVSGEFLIEKIKVVESKLDKLIFLSETVLVGQNFCFFLIIFKISLADSYMISSKTHSDTSITTSALSSSKSSHLYSLSII